MYPETTQATISSIAGIVGRNLIIARAAAGLTQQELAERALVSRATIVQIESGAADPKLSTLQQIARALGVASTLLLVGMEDLHTLEALLPHEGESDQLPSVRRQSVQLQELLSTGRVRELIEAARLASRAAQDDGADRTAAITAAIGAILFPAA